MNEFPRKETFYSSQGLCFHLKCSWRHLQSVADHAGSHYKPFDEIQGQKKRHIDAPDEILKKIQSKIARLLRPSVYLPESMLGGRKGGSPKKNAEAHLGQKLIFKLDIRDCFPSIGKNRVFRIFRNQLNFSDKISNTLTKLTTFQNRLPQGAPTSSILANLALTPVHHEIQSICKNKDVTCTFFVDDITLSGDRVKEVIEPVITALKHNGFAMRPSKVKLLAKHREEQKITGIVVNGSKLSNGSKRKAKIVAKIRELASSSTISASAQRSIKSSIAHAKYISPTQGESLEALARKKLPTHVLHEAKPLSKSSRCPCKSTHKHTHRYNKRRAATKRAPEQVSPKNVHSIQIHPETSHT